MYILAEISAYQLQLKLWAAICFPGIHNNYESCVSVSRLIHDIHNPKSIARGSGVVVRWMNSLCLWNGWPI